LYRAFSVTELLVVVCVLLILVSLLVVGGDLVYTNALQLKCQHNLEQIGQACQMYATANHGMFPKAWDMHSHRRWYDSLLAENYVDNQNAIGCPLEPDPPVAGGLAGYFEGSEEVVRGLEWLKAEQNSSTGAWDQEGGGYPEHNSPYHRIGITSLALRAFLHNGCTDRYPTKYAETVRKAIEYLIGQQNANTGKFPGYTGYWYLYDHAIATLAMTETYMLTGRADARKSASKALQHLLGLQANSEGYGWCYDANYSDAPLANWSFQAIAAGRKAGLISESQNAEQIDEALRLMVRSDGTTIYRYAWGSYAGSNRGYPRTQAATAGSLVSHLLLGKTDRVPDILNALQHKKYDYARAGSDFQLYNYFYMTLGYSLYGGNYWTVWQNKVFPKELVDQQTQVMIDGEEAGYWDKTLCMWGSKYLSSTRYTTALAANAVLAGNPGYWHPERAMGKCSYGYNSLVGDSRRTPAADTVLAMDYNVYIIVRGVRDEAGNLDPDANDDEREVALRHGGKANVLFADCTVRALAVPDLAEHMWTPEPGQ
jgi:prepilin-type processing-associated H-X9-DG protein